MKNVKITEISSCCRWKNLLQNPGVKAKGQYGFRPDRSAKDLIYAARTIYEKTIEYEKVIHIEVVDLEAAFDYVKREKLWRTLEEKEVPEELMRAIQSMYRKSKSLVRTANLECDIFLVKQEVKQG